MMLKEMVWMIDGKGYKTTEPHRFLVRKCEESGEWTISRYDEFGDVHEYCMGFNSHCEAMSYAWKIFSAELGVYLV